MPIENQFDYSNTLAVTYDSSDNFIFVKGIKDATNKKKIGKRIAKKPGMHATHNVA